MRNVADTISTNLIAVIAFFMCVFHLYTAGFGAFESIIQRSIHLAFAMGLVFLIHPGPAFIRRWIRPLPLLVINLILIVAALAPLYYLYANQQELAQRFQFVTPVTNVQLIFNFLLIGLVLEACRRVAGWVLPFIIIVCLSYIYIPDLPGVLRHGGYSINAFVDAMYLTSFGIFGIPLGASANFIALFIIFGAFLERSGLGRFIIDIANAIAGQYRGGPAKVSIIASAMMGSISGSAPANVLTTGTLTIPLMKRVGYPPHQAGAIEAAASAAGPLLPPIMGSVVFLMAQFTNVPYSQLIWIALPPALLYLIGIFLAVHWNALKLDIKGLDRSELPNAWHTFMRDGHLLLPIVVLIYFLIDGKSPQYSVFYSILSVLLIANLRRHSRMGVIKIFEAMTNGAKGAVMVAIATAAVGMIVGVFELTGLGLRLSQVAAVTIDSLLFGLFVTMLVSIVLGMAVPPSASYIVQVSVTIPMLIIFLGTIPDISNITVVIIAHFFVLYFSVMAVLTPPDALASIAAAGLAGSGFMRTALTATRIAFVGFSVPYIFVYRPGILLQGDWQTIMLDLIIAVFTVFMISLALEGYLLKRLTVMERLMAVASGVLIIHVNYQTTLAGIGLAVLLLALQMYKIRFERKFESVS